MSVQPEEGQDRHDDDDQADQIDQTIHWKSPRFRIQSRVSQQGSFDACRQVRFAAGRRARWPCAVVARGGMSLRPEPIDKSTISRHRPEGRRHDPLFFARMSREFARLALGAFGVVQQVVGPAHRFLSDVARILAVALVGLPGRTLFVARALVVERLLLIAIVEADALLTGSAFRLIRGAALEVLVVCPSQCL
jgi:hypothetical protein